nr:TonB-dependent receptor [uncultured Holophaga sp.]
MNQSETSAHVQAIQGSQEMLTTNRKALTINLDPQWYGTFAEIGAAQEVARAFFRVGGAAGTVAKSISAYDMVCSDTIYGKAPRYVSHERLQTMMDTEYNFLIDQLAQQRGDRTCFFVFADTVAARNFKGDNECHGWMGVRFQTRPGGEPSEILIHVRMWDKEAVLQQEALAIVGVNLCYAAFYYRDDPRKLIESLVDRLGTDRIEIDMLKLLGPAFEGIDNRLTSIYLVELGITNAVLFRPDGDVVQPSEVLRKKAILVERGRFNPVTRLHTDMLACATRRFQQEERVQGKELVVLMELSLNNLLGDPHYSCPQDIIDRVELMSMLGHTVLISNLPHNHRLAGYLRRYTSEMVGIAMGALTFYELMKDEHYTSLPGGILEALGRLFRYDLKLYVYPAHGRGPGSPLVTGDTVDVLPHLKMLYAYMLYNHLVESLWGFDESCLDAYPNDVLHRIESGDASWESMVPAITVPRIKELGLFGWKPEQTI